MVGLFTRNKAALLCSGALMMGVGAQAYAQDEGTVRQSDSTLLGRLVVGAGVEKVAIDTPQAVTVIDQQEIDEDQATTVGEVIERVPGVNISGSDRVFGQTFNIRGIGAPESAGEEGRIIVTVDGANKFYEQYRMGGFFSDPELYKRIEVLRGPASSTLYGSGALGGVIRLETKDASDFIADGQTGALRLKGSYNSNKDGWLGAAVLAQRWGDNAEFLLTGNYRRADSYVDGDGVEIPSSDYGTWSGLAKGTFQMGDEGTLRLSYQQWDSDADDQDYAQVGTSSTFGMVDRHVIDRTAVASYENPFSDNDWLDLKVSASFSDTTVEQRDNKDAVMTVEVAPGVPIEVPLTCSDSQVLCDSDYGYQTWQFSVENTSEWRGDAWENYLTYGWQTAYQIRTAEVIDSSGASSGIGFHPEGTDLKTGIFVQNEFIWNNRLTIIPGMRIDWHELSPDNSLAGAEDEDDFAFSPKIAAHYKFNDTFALFGSIAHTERFPTLDEIYSNDFAGTPAPPNYSLGLKKERSNNYELGFAVSGYDLLQAGDGLDLKVTGFYNDIKDLIERQRNQYPQYVNIGRAEIYGAEVELAYDSRYVFANAGYTYLEGRDKDTDEDLTSVAPHELALTLGGKLPDYDLKFGWKARFVAAPQDSCRRSDEAVDCAGGSPTRYAESFDVHDVFLTWTPDDGQFAGWEAQFGVENIFDKQYKEFLQNDPAPGRTFKVSLAKQIGW